MCRFFVNPLIRKLPQKVKDSFFVLLADIEANEPTYSVSLRGARAKEGLTQAELVRRAKIPQAHISKMENGKMEIGKERAKRLADVLSIDYRHFL